MPKVLAVIPARLASQRLPQKPLQDIAGKSLIRRVWERGSETRGISRLIIATDSLEIRTAALGFGAEVVMTSGDISTGSERVAAVWRMLQQENWDYVINLQGDMPFIRSELIERCLSLYEQETQQGNLFDVCTVATPILDQSTFESANDVKVVVGPLHQALYFSRAPIPYARDGLRLQYLNAAGVQTSHFGLKHLGLYVFHPRVLPLFESAGQSALEQVEKLEQLRLLELGHRIGVCIVPPELSADSVEVDTAADLARAIQIARKQS